MKKGGVGALIERKKRKELAPVAKARSTGKARATPKVKSTKGKPKNRTPNADSSEAGTKKESSLSASSQDDDHHPKPCKESQLELQPWYFGAIPRDEATEKLKTEGSFLCRLTLDSMGAEALILSIAEPGGTVVHCPINVFGYGPARTFAVDGDRHESVHALVTHYIRTKEPIKENKGTDVLIKRGVRRPAYWLRSSNVKETKVVGQGRYGDVCGCDVRLESKTEDDKLGMWVEAQLKKSRLNATDDERRAMVKEAKLLKTLVECEQIVKLVGLVADKFPMGLVLELPGEQLCLVIVKGTLTDARRLQLLSELAAVVEFLASKRILHRCIRAANCYLSLTSQLHLSEFSWAKRGLAYQTRPAEEKVPSGMGRWSALESVSSGAYSVETEMWCVGVVGWELWASGAEPWPFVEDASLEAKLRGGERLSTTSTGGVPGLGPALQRCWEPTSAKRPSATSFKLQLAQLQKNLAAQPAAPFAANAFAANAFATIPAAAQHQPQTYNFGNF